METRSLLGHRLGQRHQYIGASAAPVPSTSPSRVAHFFSRIPVYLEICTCILLVINTVFAFLELSTAYALPIFTWISLISIQSIFLVFVFGNFHGQIGSLINVLINQSKDTIQASLIKHSDIEASITAAQQRASRVAASLFFSLAANAQILRLYLYVPSGPALDALDSGFDSSTVPTFPELALFSVFIFQIGAFALYLSEASTALFEFYWRLRCTVTIASISEHQE